MPIAARTARRVFAALLLTLLTGSGAVTPVLERDVGSSAPALESEHHDGCVPVHDHRICVQVVANAWAPGPEGSASPPRGALERVALAAPGPPEASGPTRLPRSRAPPVS